MIAIVGGGCSGLLVAANLLRQGAREDITIFEPREELGRGMAYSTRWYEHLLNVSAARMSAYPDRPSDFVDWLENHGWPSGCGASFAPRRVYGEYLGDVLRRAMKGAAASLHHVRAEVKDIEPGVGGFRLVTEGRKYDAHRVVLALGNPQPRPLAMLQGFDEGESCYASVWSDGAVRLNSREERVLLIGTGLTAIDAVLALEAGGHSGPLHLLSRRGQLPHPHWREECEPPFHAPQNVRLKDLLRSLRAAGRNWRCAVDALRPETNRLWQELGAVERGRFLRHGKVYWDTHRHRMAPEIGDRIDHLRNQGRLHVHAGRLSAAYRAAAGLEANIALRRGGQIRIEVDRIINCTGIEERYSRSSRPLIRSLMNRGMACANETDCGFACNQAGALLASGGTPSDRLFTLGPTRSGELLETVAVPEIREQAAQLAARLIQENLAAIESRARGASPSPSEA